jgi:aminoglycoside/choline kinase family phosphotransferase
MHFLYAGFERVTRICYSIAGLARAARVSWQQICVYAVMCDYISRLRMIYDPLEEQFNAFIILNSL